MYLYHENTGKVEGNKGVDPEQDMKEVKEEEDGIVPLVKGGLNIDIGRIVYLLLVLIQKVLLVLHHPPRLHQKDTPKEIGGRPENLKKAVNQ